MAVPDPDMPEMRIMSYESSKRACKKQQAIPYRNDFIQVLWCLDDIPGQPEKCCLAEVLHITGYSEQGCLAHGVILYLPDNNWDEQIHTVEFLTDGKLRRALDERGNNSENDENENPALEWKFASGSNEKTAASDDEWEPRNDNNSAAWRTYEKMDSSSREHQQEIASIREGHAALAVEVQKLKRELASLKTQIRSQSLPVRADDSCSGADMVFSHLRYKLALKAQACLRSFVTPAKKKSTSDSCDSITVRTGDALHVGTLKVKVDCTLRQYEQLSLMIKSNANPASVTFFPAIAYTQYPSQYSAVFRTLFATFAHLATHLGLSSKADRLELARKCGMGPQGDILRMLATYSFDKNDATKPARLFPGASCGSLANVEKADSSTSNLKEAAKLYPVLFRKTRQWDAIDKRFLHEIRVENLDLPSLSEESSEEEAFQLQWRRASELTSRSWSRALIKATEIHGWLEVILPFVQVQGKYLCTEMGGKASDDVWEAIL